MSKEQPTNNAEMVEDKQLNSRLQECPIAIVGMSSVFAESKNLAQFWDNIVQSVNGIQDIPEDRWAIDDYYSSDKKDADKSYCKRGAFLPEIDFDPMEFGLPPNILELTDITQLMSLVVARDVLADAGIADEARFDRDKMGIILGVGGGQKQGGQLVSRLQTPIIDKVLKASGVEQADRDIIIDKFKKAYIPWEENSFPGLLGNVIAGRIANRFNFGGTNCVVDAACAGSLAAIKMAVSELLENRSDMMISGGVCCDNSPFMYLSFSKTPAFTDGEDIRPFDEMSSGMMIGEGVGMVALKRLSDAERDGDKIYAVIKGIGSSSDGRFKSIYAPRPEGQLKALKRAYNDAGFDPQTCGLIEAHGTGTKAGDVAEFNGLKLLFSENDEHNQHVALGSVKSQVGHTKAAAGTAGLIKAALSLHHKILPATINVDKPNQNLGIEKTPLYINNETRPWMPRADGIKRRAGISAFGFGGTNFHFVLEEYKSKHERAYRLNDVPQTILLSAPDKSALLSLLNEWSKKLSVDVESQVYQFNALVIEHPLKTPDINVARCGFVAKNASEALSSIAQILQQLASDNSTEWSKPTGIYYRESGLDTQGKIVALFSGQGSQYVNMGRDLVCNFPSMLEVNVQMDKQFSDGGAKQLSQTLYPIPVFSELERKDQETQLRLTEYAQPAIGAFSVGLYKTFQQAGFHADFTAGHSFGELTALWAANVVSDSDFMTLARSRGQAMAAPNDKDFDAGAMIAVVGDPEKVAINIADITGISIANYNANNQVVVAGVSSQIAIASTQLQEQGFKVVPLPVSAAFHTELVGHAQKPFADVIDTIKFNSPSIPVYANGTAKAHSENGDQIKASLKEHILNSVHFSEEVSNLYNAGGRVFIEFGPKNVLTRLVDNILTDKNDVTTIAINANPKKSADLQMRLAAVEMAVLGIQLENVDPYNAVSRPVVAPKKSPLAMKLSGASYVSPKTKKAFTDSLNDGWTLTKYEPKIIEKEVIKEVIVEKIVEKIVYVNTEGEPINNAATSGDSNDLAKRIEQSVASFVDHQSQLLNVHEQYMQGPKEYAKTFQNVISAQTGAVELPESLDKTLGMYHDFQTETLRVHEAYLNSQTDNMQRMLSSAGLESTLTATPVVNSVVEQTVKVNRPDVLDIQEQLNKTHQTVQANKVNSPVVIEVAETSTIELNEPVFNINKIETVMMEVVADKTGYPVEMLELSMDMEADLGIDSIKRVEILGAVQDEIDNLPELNAEDLAEQRTLGDIVTYMQSQAPVISVQSTTAGASTPATIDVNKIETAMMAVVADKTGYPVEMLELSMDMEADLGIDSIKRVEILGAVQDEIADLPELNAEDLAEQRTLGDIVTYMQSQASVASVESTTSVTSKTDAIDINKIETAMMEVVADKTGYPVEMLELSMDMEADLGIDSIKRVEILGAVQDEIADLPELNAEDLAEQLTLGDIVTYMQSQAPATEISAKPLAPIAMDVNKIETIMMEVVADKTGYPVDMLELSMDMEADLGIDSIKRVEILGAVQDEIADLPELNAEDLAEQRTLGDIVTYMQSQASVASVESTTSVTSKTDAIDINKIETAMMEVVADKTGYPVEMLELSMDMEADLGIDSIKRVEILGAVQDEIADLPELNAEDLAEQRTLGDIVTYMQSQAPVAVTEQVAVINSPVSIDVNKIETVMMEVVADKTGYPVEMLELSMDMEADLGIDSIKRVEILGAVQDEIAYLPELDAETLSEKRTLGQIVDYMMEVGRSITATNEIIDQVETEQPAIAIVKDIVEFKPAPSATVTIKHMEPPRLINQELNGENLLLVDNGETASVLLANKLTLQGWSVTVLQCSWIKSSRRKKFDDAVNQLTLNDVNESEIKAVLETQSNWQSVVYLHPKTAITDIEYPVVNKQGLVLAFLLAKLSGLGKNNTDVRSSFIALTHQGGSFGVDNQETDSDLVQSGLSGLVKTLSHEWQSVFCRIVDLPSKCADDKVANILIDELNDQSVYPIEIGFNNNGRLTLISEETDSYALSAGNSINEDSVFLVSGGAKGVTAHCVIELAKQYKSKFILLGRSVYNSQEPSWAANIIDHADLKKAAMQYLISQGEKPTPVAISQVIKPVLADREIKQTLDLINAAGGIAEYVSADVTNSENVKDAVEPVTDLWGAITGIIHGAGVLADKFIEQKTLAEFEAVYSTKVDGLLSLLACCQVEQIKHLVLFSSAAGFYGNPGQSDYAIANEILNKTAYRYKALYPSTQVLSFNWGPWDGGMVTPELKRMFNDRGVYIIPLDAGAKLLVSELGADTNRCPQILVGNDMGGEEQSKEELIQEDTVKKPSVSRLSKTLLAANNPFLIDHQIGDDQVLPTVCAIAWMVNACAEIFPDYHYQGLQDYKLFKGIVFDGQEASQYDIDLTLLSDENEQLMVAVKISSDNAGKTQFHYGATLLLTQQVKAAPVFDGVLPMLTTSKQPSAIELYRDGTLFHGESLQGFVSIDAIDNQGLLMSCHISSQVKDKQGEFDLQSTNIFANDLVYQAMLVWVKKQLSLGSLPSATLAWTVYREVKLDQNFYLKLQVTEQQGSRISADILLIDNDKNIMADIKGAQVTSSESLNNLFNRTLLEDFA
jgi:acyl transferase domain-containing protein